MPSYAVVCSINPVYVVNADDKDDAEDKALDLFIEEYNISPPEMAYVDEVTEVK